MAVHDHQCGSAAVALGPCQLARCCLTRGTVHSVITAAGAVLQCSHAWENWRGTCERSTGMVMARTSLLNTATAMAGADESACRARAQHPG